MSNGALQQTALIVTLLLGCTFAKERIAFLRHGSLGTSRLLLDQPRRSLAEGTDAHAAQVWVVGLPEQQQAAVQHTLRAWGGQVLHPLPDREAHHWLVLATEHAMRQLLAQHHDATAALLPDELKIAPEVLAPDNDHHGALRVLKLGIPDPKPRHTTLVALAPTASASDLQQLAGQAQEQLPSVLGQSCKLAASPGTQHLRVTVCTEGSSYAALWLARQRLISWVDSVPPIKSRNLIAGAITQASSEISKQLDGKKPAAPPPADLMARPPVADFFPFWKAGLTGKGEVVTVLDTGADLDSCFLWDPDFKDYRNGSSTKFMPIPAYLPRNAANESLSSFMYPVATPNNIWVFQNKKARKVIQYVMWSDNVDGQSAQNTEGHGTHISTTIAGSPYGFDPVQVPTLGTGLAPDAKIAIFDVGSTDADGNAVLDIFTDKGQDPAQLYEPSRKVGARITSTSIGPPSKTYHAPTCYLLDAYARGVPGTLHVVAAGNSGNSQSHKYRMSGTVEAPATCKNVLAVGSTESWTDVGERSFQPFDLLDNNGTLVNTSLSNYTFPHVLYNTNLGTLRFTAANGSVMLRLSGEAGEFAPMQWASCCSGPTSEFDILTGIKLKLVLPDPATGCNLTKSFSSSEPVMVLLRKTAADNADIDQEADYGALYGYADYDHNKRTCNAAATVASLVKNKAAAALFYWANRTDSLTYLDVAINTLLPTAVVERKGAGELLEALLRKGQTVYAEWVPMARPWDLPPYENVAWFSSYGSSAGEFSTFDARIKPELVAPGYLVSAHSDGKFSGKMDQCAVIEKVGTSMSAPVASGAAALVRQYFKDGYYKDGAPDAQYSHDPSAPLVKAVLIAGTAAMKGISVMDGKPLKPPPSPYQGFGRLDLAGSLPLAGDAHWRMQVVDSAVMSSNGAMHVYSLNVQGNPDGAQKPLVATLVWHDFPAFPGARQVLVNNLDLIVQGPINSTAANKTAPEHWGNGKVGGDFLNNVEKVVIPNAKPGRYVIVVRTSYLFIGAAPQPYSLVVLGDIKGILDSRYNPALRQSKSRKPSPSPSPQAVNPAWQQAVNTALQQAVNPDRT